MTPFRIRYATQLALLATTLLMALSPVQAGPLSGLLQRDDQTLRLNIDGHNRKYILHTPADYSGGALPLLVVLHGGYGSAANAQRSLGFDDYADARRFAVAYGEGYRSSWADGRGTGPAAEAGVDDRRYLQAIVADASSRLPIDPARVYLTGLSNGGMMSLRMACETSTPFRAYATVIANVPEPLAASCAPQAGGALLTINGVEDPLMPIDGGDCCGGGLLGQGGRVISADASAELFRSSFGCGTSPAVELLPPAVDDGTWVEHRQWSGCASGARLQAYRVHGMGHAWPPRRPILPTNGSSSGNLDATQVIVEFLFGAP